MSGIARNLAWCKYVYSNTDSARQLVEIPAAIDIPKATKIAKPTMKNPADQAWREVIMPLGIDRSGR
jgi:hypothetical protein